MPRTARRIIPNAPHYITQRGARDTPLFTSPADYRLYVIMLSKHAQRYGVRFWSWCLLPNEVYFIAVPQDKDALALMFRESHRRYTALINERDGTSGNLWYDRFSSLAMGVEQAVKSAKMIETKPVTKNLVSVPQNYKWSSAAYHCGQRESDPLVTSTHPLLNLVSHWQDYLTKDTHVQKAYG